MIRPFGLLTDGRSVEAITLGSPDGLQVDVLTYGAILRRLTFPVRGIRRDLILSLDRLEDYERDRAYVGPLVGRFGNRIARARFELDGLQHAVTANEGDNHLHGGALGFSKRIWRVLDGGGNQDSHVVLGYHSPAGEEGYPGAVDATVELSVRGAALSIVLGARTNAATPVNLTYHPYFNLSGSNLPATDQRLRIPASHYLPVTAGLIPTGEIAPVDGTPFDFRASRRLHPPSPLAHAQLKLAGGYDHCWVLDTDADCACELSSADLSLTMSGGPGLQFYNGQFLSRTHPSLGSGVILEPQGLPNAPNESKFPGAILRPGETYRAAIEYQLRAL